MPTAAGRHRTHTPSFGYGIAGAADDGEVRRLLRDHPMPGRIRLSFEREPDTAMAAALEGDTHQTVLARDARSGILAGVASRAARMVFVNGAPRRLGYLSQFRVAHGVRRLRSLLDDGFAWLRELHDAGEATAYLVSLVADNAPARRLLIDRRSRTGPAFVPAGRLTTFALPARRARAPARLGRAGRIEDVEQIAACLERNLRRYQFAPVWRADSLLSTPRTRGLAISDFALAERGGRIVGCAALWDQRAFKQVVVRGYDPALRRARWLVNAAAPWLGVPRLPAVGETLALAYVSHLAADDDDPATIAMLLDTLRDQARRAGLEYVVAAAPAGHPVASAIAGAGRHRQYASDLYLACWADGESFAASLDGRPPQPEIAIL